MSKSEPADPSIISMQRSMFANAARHGVSQVSFAEHLSCVSGKDVSRGTVSHFTTSGDRASEMTLGQLVALLQHTGEGPAAAEVLAPLLRRVGVEARPVGEAAATANAMRLAKEANEAVAAVLTPGLRGSEVLQEIDEAIAELEAHRIDLLADGVH